MTGRLLSTGARGLPPHCGRNITELAQRAQFHQARLAEHLIPSSLSYQEGLRRAAQHFTTAGSGTQRQAVGWLGQLVQNQASILAYIDVFWCFAIFAVVMIPVALMLKSIGSQQVQMGH